MDPGHRQWQTDQHSLAMGPRRSQKLRMPDIEKGCSAMPAGEYSADLVLALDMVAP